MNKIYTFLINDNLKQILQDFQDSLGQNERIIAQTVVGVNFVITTEITDNAKKTKNLLLEEIKAGKII